MPAEERILVREKGDWSSHENKGYVGKIDRVHVSRSEKWEVAYFVDHWLGSRGAEITNLNRDKATKVLERYDGTVPLERDELTCFPDDHFKRKPR